MRTLPQPPVQSETPARAWNGLKRAIVAGVLPVGAGLATGYLLRMPIPFDILEIPLGNLVVIPALVISLVLKHGYRIALENTAFIYRFIIAHIIASFFLLAFNVVQLVLSGVLIVDSYFERQFSRPTKGDVPSDTRVGQLKNPQNQPQKKINTFMTAHERVMLSDLKELNNYIDILLAQENPGGGKDNQ